MGQSSSLRNAPVSVVGENYVPIRNRVQWGPIVAGIATAIVTFLLLTILGFALGASVLEPANSAGEIGTWAAVWGAISAVLAFLVGGWIAARTAAVDGSFAGLMNGLMVGAGGLLFIIWLSASGLGNLFGTIGSTVSQVANVAATTAPAAQEATGATAGEAGDAVEQATGVNVDDPQAAATAVAGQVQQVADQAGEAIAGADNQQTFDAVRNGALGTFLGLLLPLLSGALGGWLGKYDREDLVRGTG
jgi:hypothetical protein